MELQELFAEGRTPTEIIRDIKSMKSSLCIPKWETLKTQYYPELHRIRTDPEFWKDKGTRRKPRKVSRITRGIQKMYTNRMTQMAYAIPVKRIYKYDKENVNQKDIVSSIESIYERIHFNSLNRKRMKEYFASCELLSIFYAVKIDKDGEKKITHSDYGFDSEYKLRCKSYSAMSGYDLYPIFDEYDDLLGMCIEYISEEYTDGVKKDIKNFEIFTKDSHVHFVKNGNSWEEILHEEIKIHKLPLAYMYRNSPIWEDQTNNVDEIELAYSRESEILRHNSAPYLKVSGQMGVKSESPAPAPASSGVVGPTYSDAPMARPGKEKDNTDDATRIIRTENGGDVEYVTWSQSIEAMKFFIEGLENAIEEELQIANLSTSKMIGLGNIGYDARKTILSDSHLKVGDESGELIMFHEREWRVIVAFLAFMNPKWAEEIKNISCEHVITPFIQNDEKAEIDKWRAANGGEPLLSQETSIKYSGLVSNVEEEMTLIQKEADGKAERESRVDVFNNYTD